MSGNNGANEQEKTLSRVGRKPIPIPKGVQVEIKDHAVALKGPKGSLTQPFHPEVKVKVENGQIVVERTSPSKFHRALHGLTRSLINNGVAGVTTGYEKGLEIMGVGFRAQPTGKGITLNVGFSHPVEIQPLEGVTLKVDGQNKITVTGCDKQKVGQMAALIRRVRPPNPYKEKGIKYAGEVLHLKPGKAAKKA
ncbi:MAG: 50S ribosomal protein L6 [SAR202 cluster bacterium]|nr:50S ribosomal protein L6 [SAR202 cluster bacterium]